MKRYIDTPPSWRARSGQVGRARFPLIVISADIHERLHAKASADNCSARLLADVLINRALDEAGAP